MTLNVTTGMCECNNKTGAPQNFNTWTDSNAVCVSYGANTICDRDWSWFVPCDSQCFGNVSSCGTPNNCAACGYNSACIVSSYKNQQCVACLHTGNDCGPSSDTRSCTNCVASSQVCSDTQCATACGTASFVVRELNPGDTGYTYANYTNQLLLDPTNGQCIPCNANKQCAALTDHCVPVTHEDCPTCFNGYVCKPCGQVAEAGDLVHSNSNSSACILRCPASYSKYNAQTSNCDCASGYAGSGGPITHTGTTAAVKLYTLAEARQLTAPPTDGCVTVCKNTADSSTDTCGAYGDCRVCGQYSVGYTLRIPQESGSSDPSIDYLWYVEPLHGTAMTCQTHSVTGDWQCLYNCDDLQPISKRLSTACTEAPGTMYRLCDDHGNNCFPLCDNQDNHDECHVDYGAEQYNGVFAVYARLMNTFYKDEVLGVPAVAENPQFAFLSWHPLVPHSNFNWWKFVESGSGDRYAQTGWGYLDTEVNQFLDPRTVGYTGVNLLPSCLGKRGFLFPEDDQYYARTTGNVRFYPPRGIPLLPERYMSHCKVCLFAAATLTSPRRMHINAYVPHNLVFNMMKTYGSRGRQWPSKEDDVALRLQDNDWWFCDTTDHTDLFNDAGESGGAFNCLALSSDYDNNPEDAGGWAYCLSQWSVQPATYADPLVFEDCYPSSTDTTTACILNQW
jgi:hypothetical protein